MRETRLYKLGNIGPSESRVKVSLVVSLHLSAIGKAALSFSPPNSSSDTSQLLPPLNLLTPATGF